MAFRAFFALPEANFQTSTGEPTNAVYGFVSMLLNLLKDVQPTHIAVAFDVGRTTFRTRTFPDYKGTRDETPAGFKGQVPLIKEVLDAIGIRWLEKPDYEADDILATYATTGRAAGFEVLICSGDRDTLQLVNEDVTVLYPVRGVSELARMTPQAVQDKYAVNPEQYPDLAALVGETSDNIPGVPGVGPKTAAKWINNYGGLRQIIDNAEEITGKVGDNLRAHLDQVKLNRQINHLVTDLELDLELPDLARAPFDREQVNRVFDSLQFRTLRERLFALEPGDGLAEHQGIVEQTVELVAVEPGSLGAWLKDLPDAAVTVSGQGKPGAGQAWGLAIATAQGQGAYRDLSDISDQDEQALQEWLSSHPKAVHAEKTAWHALTSRGLDLGPVSIDTEIAAYLLYPDQRSYDVVDLAQRYGVRVWAASGEDTTQAQGAFDFDATTGVAGGPQVAQAATIAGLAPALQEDLAGRENLKLLTGLEQPLTAVIARMEHLGIAADLEKLSQLERQFAEQSSEAAQQAYQVIGREVNLGSPKQLQQVLFEELKMPLTKKIKTGYTTDAAALHDLFAKTQHPFLEHLLVHRDVTKLRQIVEGLTKAVADDGRIHTTFQQTIAATGRLSSTDPNLQNIPIRTAAGRQIRSIFVVGEGYETLLTADYSQIEMRIMAHLSQDAGLIEAFAAGEDLHNYVGARVFNVDPQDITADMRSMVKAMSYGLAYGLSAFGLSKQLNIEVPEASALMDDYFERFGGVRDYLETVVAQARKTGWTATLLGRRRYLPDLSSDNRQRREMAERMALNAPIQGSAADIIKVAMLAVDDALRTEGLKSRMLLQVHDELVFEVAPGEREAVEALARKAMGQAIELDVPLDVSVGVGTDWQQAGH